MLDIFIIAVTILLAIGSVLMTLAILIQRPRSEGLGSAFGGGMTESLFGAETTDVLTKVTIWLSVFFFSATLLLAYLMTHKESQRGETTRDIRATAEERVIDPSDTPAIAPPESSQESESTSPETPVTPVTPEDTAPSEPAPAPTP